MGPRAFRRRGLIVGAAVGSAAARRGQQSAAPEQDAQTQPAPATDNSYAKQLAEMEDLKAKGMITDEEYEAKRKQILGL
jgi:hypothetical protein